MIKCPLEYPLPFDCLFNTRIYNIKVLNRTVTNYSSFKKTNKCEQRMISNKNVKHSKDKERFENVSLEADQYYVTISFLSNFLYKLWT